MAKCFLCNTRTSSSVKTFSRFNLGREGISIPNGMGSTDVICNDCYQKEKAQYHKSQMHVGGGEGLEVRGVEFHNKALTPEEIKAMYERGPPSFDDKEPHFISHDDEKDGYLWIDGKKVKKNESEDLK